MPDSSWEEVVVAGSPAEEADTAVVAGSPAEVGATEADMVVVLARAGPAEEDTVVDTEEDMGVDTEADRS